MISLLLLAVPSVPPRPFVPRPGNAHIQASVKVRPGIYTLADRSGNGALQIDADGVTVDFQGATLQSPAARGGQQEAYEGVGLAVNGHRNVTIKNAVIHGYRYNVRARNCSGLKLVNCELGQSRSQKIVDGESVNAIWLVIRDLGAWRSYGAGAWLEGCTRSSLRNVRANQCQNGLVLVNSDRNTVSGCDFSYTSGWGLAMWSSSDNLICWNHADFVNRPWGGGWGGDSSGFTLTSGSHRNVFAYNSLTHGGDGFFLASRSEGYARLGNPQDSGSCDDNVVVGNDGSWSPHNAFESTFSSRNAFYRNLANESDYGFWLGYSDHNTVRDNEIRGSHADGIAHEHGTDNTYANNVIAMSGGAAIHLWAGGSARSQSMPSARNRLIGNTIVGARAAFDVAASTDYSAAGNVVRDAPISAGFAPLRASGTLHAYTVPRLAEIRALKPKGFTFYRDTDRPKGWDWLVATPYGMRDYRGMLVPWMMQDTKTLRLLVDPKRVKRLVLPDGLVSRKGAAPNEVFVTIGPAGRPTGEYRDYRIQAIGTGGRRQAISARLLDADWHVRWFKWFSRDPEAYSDTEAWRALYAGPALKEEVLPALPAIAGYAAPEPGLPTAYFALAATTQVRLEAGTYRFDTLSDDGIQVLVDGKPVVDNWTHHGGTNDSAQTTVSAGMHAIEVRYCQENGAAALSVHWTKTSD